MRFRAELLQFKARQRFIRKMSTGACICKMHSFDDDLQLLTAKPCCPRVRSEFVVFLGGAPTLIASQRDDSPKIEKYSTHIHTHQIFSQNPYFWPKVEKKNTWNI